MHALLLTVLLVAPTWAADQGRSPAAPADASAVELRLIANEKASWEAARRKDYAAFASLLSDDFVDIFPNGKIVGKKELVEQYIRGVDLREYSLSDFRVVWLSRDAALVVYRAVARGSEHQIQAHTVSGEEIEVRAAVTSGWALRDGVWKNVFYRENDLP